MQDTMFRTRVMFPAGTIFDFAGVGLAEHKGQLAVNAGAGLTFDINGTLMPNLGNGLAIVGNQICIIGCIVAAMLAGSGLKVSSNCQLETDFTQTAGCGILVDDNGNINVDVNNLAGAGLAANGCQFVIDPVFLSQTIQTQIASYTAVDSTQTMVVPYTIDTEFRYKPNGYGYNSGLEIVKTFSTLIVFRNTAGMVVGIQQGEVQTSTQDFDFGTVGVQQNVAERPCTPSAPNFYAN